MIYTHSKRESILFDGDDTLWETQVIYEKAKQDFYTLMDSVGFSVPLVKKAFAHIDVQNVQRLGFSRDRFPTSMRETYKWLCHYHGLDINSSICRQATIIGNTVFTQEPTLFPETKNILGYLSLHYDLYLLTVGDIIIQQQKIDSLQIAHYFQKTCIREHKDSSVLQQFLQSADLDVARTWVVGNSIRSDINPALQLGLRCIWIRHGSWEYDQEPLQQGSVWAIENLAAIRDIVEKHAYYEF